MMKEFKMMKELKNSFRPEFLNRVDDIIVFHKLTKDELKEIVTMMVNKLKKMTTKKGQKSPDTIVHLII